MNRQYPPHVYMPQHNLYPDQPQMLHQLVVEFFVRAPDYTKHAADLFAMVPTGPIYAVGMALAEAWKDIFTGIQQDRSLVLIAGAMMDDDISALVTADIALHAWFWQITLDPTSYVGGVTVDSARFATYAAGIEAQLPFIRAYARRDNVMPYIVNMSKSQESFEDFLDSMFARHGENAVYVFVQPDKGIEKFLGRVERR